MIRIDLYLREDQLKALSTLKGTGYSRAELIRKAIDRMVVGEPFKALQDAGRNFNRRRSA